MESCSDLAEVIEWLQDRRYLPKEGEDYETVATVHEVAGYKLEWFGIKPLVEGFFMSLA